MEHRLDRSKVGDIFGMDAKLGGDIAIGWDICMGCVMGCGINFGCDGDRFCEKDRGGDSSAIAKFARFSPFVEVVRPSKSISLGSVTP